MTALIGLARIVWVMLSILGFMLWTLLRVDAKERELLGQAWSDR